MRKNMFLAILFSTFNCWGADSTLKTDRILKTIVATPTPCQSGNDSVRFLEINKSYKLYETDLKDVRAIKCQKITSPNQTFFTVEMTAQALSGNKSIKVLLYEIALLSQDKNTLSTVRSEQLDQLEVNADLPNLNFRNSQTITWGLDQKNLVIIKIQNSELDKKTEPYYIKFDSKSNWFVNDFSND